MSTAKLLFPCIINKQTLRKSGTARRGGAAPRLTHHGDTDSVLVLLREDTHQSRGQKQQDQGVLKLKNESRAGGFFFSLSQTRLGFLPSSMCDVVPHSEPGFQASNYSGRGEEGHHPATVLLCLKSPRCGCTDTGYTGFLGIILALSPSRYQPWLCL